MFKILARNTLHVIFVRYSYESQAGIKIAGRNTNNLKKADDTRTKEPLNEGEGGKWKCWLETKH